MRSRKCLLEYDQETRKDRKVVRIEMRRIKSDKMGIYKSEEGVYFTAEVVEGEPDMQEIVPDNPTS